VFRKSSYCDTSACLEVDFVKSSFSATNGCCVEVGFHKSTYSADTSNCVEVATCACNEVLVRDSKNPDGTVLAFSGDAWSAFLADLKAGDLDLPRR
jgi:hypothetical protein